MNDVLLLRFCEYRVHNRGPMLSGSTISVYGAVDF